MNDFMTFMSHLNAVDAKDSPALNWLTNPDHYDFLDHESSEEKNYTGFVNNLIASYYELLLQPFLDQEEARKNSEEVTLKYSSELQALFQTIILSDVWKVTSVSSRSGGERVMIDPTRDLLLIGLLVVLHRFQLFEELKDILSFLSELEMREPADLIPLYERLAIRYESQGESEESKRAQEKVDLLKILPLLSFTLEKADMDSSELQLIFDELAKSRHVKDYLVNRETLKVYAVHSERQDNAFNPDELETRLFAHGTRNRNILSILEHGIETSPQTIATGSSLGVGAYFAKMTEIGKSAQYSDDFLILAEVAVGKRKYTDQVKDYRQEILSTGTPYQSLHYLGGQYSSFSYDEIVVYTNAQIRVKYLVHLR